MIYSLPEIMDKNKSLTFIPQWIEKTNGWLECTSTIDIEGVTIQGIEFRSSTYKNSNIESVGIQLFDHNLKQASKAIYRADWNPTLSHPNKAFGPKELRFTEIKGSHHHPFELNFMPELARIRERNLPIAIPITPNPKNYFEFLAFVGKAVNISNISLLELPPWERRLL